ncbi:MAG TPA: disulfide isomerase DsbC N-terminal domain-containing protein, partial [Methylophilaceae bacterium]|nr:disulfide isomerase DsbC N-terminal domain-containing protein [Methylophilaceae bacterium]
MSKRIIGLIMASLLTSSAYADEASLKKSIETVYPKLKVQSITKTPYAGLYEVFLDGQIIYTDDKFSFLIAEGKVIDPVSRRNLT